MYILQAMDELVIGEKKYISSKKAAELTGYAKDYIGQLCREGRVEARLVGRSWYVLESSIAEHRFGKQEEVVKEPEAEESEVVEESGWKSPRYVTETVATLPELIERPRAPLPSSLNLLARDRNIISAADIASNQAEVELVPISRQEEPAEEPPAAPQGDDEEVSVTLHRVAPHVAPQTKDMDVIVPTPAPRRHLETQVEPRKIRKQGSLVKSSIVIAIALVAISIMLLGTGAADRYLLPAAQESGLIKYLGGKSTYIKQ